jgi:hypothetical protein
MSFRFACSADSVSSGNEDLFFDGTGAGGLSTVSDTAFGTGARRAFRSLTSGADHGIVSFALRGGTVVDPDQIYFQIRLKSDSESVPAAGRCLFQVVDGATVQVSIVLNSDWTISAWRGATVAGLLGSPSTFTVPTGWNSQVHTLRGRIRIHPTLGEVELRWNSDDVTPILNLTGQNTRNSATAQATGCNFLGTATGGLDIRWSDTAVWSSAGSDGYTGWKNPLVFPYVASLADVTVAWTPSTGTNHAALVDDATLATTDYNSSVTVGQEDILTLNDIAAPIGVIHSVIPMAVAATPDAGANTLAVGLDISGTQNYSAGKAMTGTAKMYQDNQSAKPGGGSWALSDFNNARIAYKVAS